MPDVFRHSMSWIRSHMGALFSPNTKRYFEISNEKRSRATATATLLGVISCATLAFALAPPLKGGAVTERNLPAMTGARYIKMIDGVPRSNVCDEQVWPYIEGRCLRRNGHAVFGAN